ncbi:hypothetical protein C8T65DRAFT_694411 [Cerioporus squamosus]|nr:hypothetical protein C8T65DRAFT_694411 [Cerioporus squamosus]
MVPPRKPVKVLFDYGLAANLALPLPRLTMLKLPEMYGALALGRAADVEADRLFEKLVREEDDNRLYIHAYSLVMAKHFHDLVQQSYAKFPLGGICPDVAYPAGMQSSDSNNGLLAIVGNVRWQLCSLWSDWSSRYVASHLLDPQIRRLQLSDHDARILVWFVAERIYTGNQYRVMMVQAAIGRSLFHLWVYRSSEAGSWEELADSQIPEPLEIPEDRSSATRPAHDHTWYRVWTLPVYAVTYFVHRRYRALHPRRLPTLTNLRLPEIYGMFAFGEIAAHQSLHLHKQLQLDENRDHRVVVSYAEWVHNLKPKGVQLELRTIPGVPDLTRKVLPRGEDGKVSLFGEILWRLRTMWTTEDSRRLASILLEDHIAACEHPRHVRR